MQFLCKANVVNASHGTLENGTPWANVNVMQATNNPNRLGYDLMKVTVSPEVFPQLVGMKFPAEVEFNAEMRPAAGGKSQIYYSGLVSKSTGSPVKN